jgi:hypothetical protein
MGSSPLDPISAAPRGRALKFGEKCRVVGKLWWIDPPPYGTHPAPAPPGRECGSLMEEMATRRRLVLMSFNMVN